MTIVARTLSGDRTAGTNSATESGAMPPCRWAQHALYAIWILAFGFFYALLPLNPDQYEFEYVAAELLRGKRLYIDIVDMNWPGIVFLHFLSAWHVPVSLTWYPWRLVDYGLMLGATALLARIVGTSSVRAGRLLKWLYPALYVSTLESWFSGQPDIIAGHVLAGAIWFWACALDRDRPRIQWVSGALLGFAALVKPVAIIAGPLLAAQLFLRRDSVRALSKLRHTTVAAMAGILIVAGGFLLVHLTGTPLEAIKRMALDYNLAPPDPKSPVSIAKCLSELFTNLVKSWHWITLLAILGLVVDVVRHPKGMRAYPMLGVLGATGLGAYFVQGRGWGYHLGIVFVTLVSSAALGLDTLVRAATNGQRWTRLVACCALLVFSLGFAKKLSAIRPRLSYLWDRTGQSKFLRRFPAGDGLSLADVDIILRQPGVISDSPNPQPLFEWGTNSAINYLSRRPSPTRFYYAPVIEKGITLPLGQDFQRQFEHDLQTQNPEFCVITENLERTRETMPGIVGHIDDLLKGYDLVWQNPRARLFRRH